MSIFLTTAVLGVFTYYVWSLITRKAKSKRGHAPRRCETAEELASRVHDRRTFNQLQARLDRAEQRLGQIKDDAAYEQQVAKIESLQKAVEIVESTHAWANFGEGYCTDAEAEEIMKRDRPR